MDFIITKARRTTYDMSTKRRIYFSRIINQILCPARIRDKNGSPKDKEMIKIKMKEKKTYGRRR
ncbi:hypothetical protein H5410_032839 [Solanum commersonii]|uniref:Uncharacterized protein n=1 Tax=Solanum commersonii TaxID=4109 RepID=A0A9J5YNE8_SOLCO|nr:hypothetical protein H5410_032839 [Solanum commersonii]